MSTQLKVHIFSSQFVPSKKNINKKKQIQSSKNKNHKAELKQEKDVRKQLTQRQMIERQNRKTRRHNKLMQRMQRKESKGRTENSYNRTLNPHKRIMTTTQQSRRHHKAYSQVSNCVKRGLLPKTDHVRRTKLAPGREKKQSDKAERSSTLWKKVKNVAITIRDGDTFGVKD